jgi:hypothetical protein
MKPLRGDALHAVCIIAAVEQIQSARQGAWAFHAQDSPHFTDTVDMMLSVGVSPTGRSPATHFICTRHDTLEALGRIETYQQAMEDGNMPRVPVTLYVCEKPLAGGADLRKQLAEHETEILDSLGLRRVA